MSVGLALDAPRGLTMTPEGIKEHSSSKSDSNVLQPLPERIVVFVFPVAVPGTSVF